MTLRLRLVAALVVLLTAGLALFGVATYALYRNSEYQRLDEQLHSSEPGLNRQLEASAGISQGPPFGSGGDGGPGGGLGASGAGVGGSGPVRGEPGGGGPALFGVYAELLDRNGTVLARNVDTTTSSSPKLPAHPGAEGTPGGRLLTVGSTSGTGHYRVLISRSDRDGNTVVVAVPTTEVTDALRRLVLIEIAGALALLAVLSAGSWLVMRRGLRPLERMAGTARSITAGDLSQRVSPSGGPTEVGQLGLALNTMLHDIEVAFLEREETERRLRQFLADASHELRTPLTSIQGFAELFRVSGDRGRVDLPTILRRIEEESARMEVLVEDLLLLARLDQRRATERAAVDLAILAADACSDLVATAPDRPVTLVAPEPVVIAGVEDHLRQAIGNLVTNAARHTDARTPVEVAARLVSGDAEVSVRDHGAGLDADALTHVFDRFWQADRARVGTGAGLGLAIVSSIAAEHGGEATAANAAGGGAIFTLRLPVGDIGAAPAAEGEAGQPGSRSTSGAAQESPVTRTEVGT